MIRKSLRVLTVLALALTLSLATAVCADASPDFDRGGDVSVGQVEPASGILGWFGALLDRLLSVLVGANCDPETDPECTAGEGGASMDSDG